MSPRILTIMTGRNLPIIRQSTEPEPSIINGKTIAAQTGILDRERSSQKSGED